MKYTLSILIIISSIFARNYHGCTLAPDNLHGWVVCLDTVLILHTTDGGPTWQPQNAPDSAERFFDVTCTDQFCAWTCGILGEIIHTDNGGLDWYGQAIGLSKYGTRIEFIDQNYGWVVCGDGTIGRTVDGGNFWEQVFTIWYDKEYYGVSFVNQWDGWVVAGYPDSMLTGQGFIIHSTDGGANWDSLYQVSSYEDFLDVHFFNLLDGIVVGGDEADTSAIILKTTDCGLSWNTITPPANSYYLRAVDFVGNEGWAVGRFGTIIHTTDAGDSWAFQTNPATTTLFDIDFSDNLHGLACGYDIILYTTDGGQTWLPTGIEEAALNLTPNALCLEIYPNPFREKTVIRCSMLDTGLNNIGQSAKSMELTIYDVAGRLVKDFSCPPPDLSYGMQRIFHRDALRPTLISWHGTDNLGRKVPEGVYFVYLNSENYQKTEKVIFLK